MNQFFIIWERNIRGAIKKCFDDFFDYDSLSAPALTLILGSILLGSLVLIIPSIISIPLFIGIFGGSFIKTIIDYTTRNFNKNQEEIQSVKASIERLDGSEMINLKKGLNLNNHSPQSNSSRSLISRISTDSEQKEELEQIEALNNKMVEKCSKSRFQYISYEGPDRGPFKNMKAVDTKNSSEKIKELKEKRISHVERGLRLPLFMANSTGHFSSSISMYLPPKPKKVGLEQSKVDLLNYISDQNNGKETFNHIVRFFKSKPATDINLKPTNDNPISLI